MDGFNELNDEERTYIKSRIESENALRFKKQGLPQTDLSTHAKSNEIDNTPTPRKIKTRLVQSTQPSFKIMFSNADQLTSLKMTELKRRIQKEKPLIIAICEVKPKNYNDRTLLDYQIPGYAIHPLNLDSNNGRGMAVYIHDTLENSVIDIKSDITFSEVCLLEVKLRGGDKLLFGSFYRSPTPTELSEENNNNLNKLLTNISSKPYSHKCFVGNFNYKDINWDNCSTVHNEESKEALFIDATQDGFLYQHNLEDSRRRGNDSPSNIDLIFTNEAMHVSEIEHFSPLGKSDHDVITFKFHCYLDYTKSKARYVFGKGDFEGMRNALKDDKWEKEFISSVNGKNVEELWNEIKSKFNELKYKFVPNTKPRDSSWKKLGDYPIDKKLQDAVRRKHATHRRWMRNKKVDGTAELSRLEYTKARNLVTKLMRQAKRKIESEVAKKAKSNPKAFWSHVNSKLKTRNGISPLLQDEKDKDSMKYSNVEKANILQKQFCSVFTKETEGGMPVLTNKTNVLISLIEVKREMVIEKIKEMNINKSCGPDNIHPRMLKELVDIMAGPIALLLNRTIHEGVIPIDWKKANVSPIFKKGSRSRASNYRPISLTSIVCKLMETFVKRRLLDHLVKENLLSAKQHGFISGRSTTTQLLSFLDKCLETTVTGGVVDSIYLDFAKAFDTVPHSRLLAKLRSYGIREQLLQWISVFLHDRTQVVVVNGEESFLGHVLSGIPQGSVLGPILFVIYINDILENINADGLLFADDTKIFRSIMSQEDALSLQEDPKRLEEWSQQWLLNFNPEKCHVLTLGKFENIRYTCRYRIYGNELEHVFDEKDLGVTIDSALSFEEHISEKVKKANSIMGLIRRSFSYLSCNLFRKLYMTFVRPHLEHAQAVWSPYLKKHINSIEKVQIRATKYVDGLKDLEYPDRLIKLDLPTMRYRRARGDMIELYKHFHTYDRDAICSKFQPKGRVSRKHGFQLHERKAKDGIRGPQSNSFYYRSVSTWNKLPSKVVNVKDINDFKKNLDEHWQHQPWKFNYIIDDCNVDDDNDD